MGKLESLKELEMLGLNTPEFLCEIRRWKEDRLEQWNDFYSVANGKISVRTERDGETSCPFLPNITLRRAAVELPKLLKQDYRILIFRGIDPKDAAFRGNYAFLPDGSFVMEWKSGPGTVRDLETELHHSSSDKHRLPAFVKDAIYWPMRMRQDHIKKGSIIEWSLYPYDVGRLKQKAIHWEIRPWQ
jgi:hypothetical protein